jgi:conjugal transfer pilus assembly protein TraW
MNTDPELHRRARVNAVARSVMLAVPLLAFVTVATAAGAKSSTIGRTWPIAEPDALAEIEARVSRQPAKLADKFGTRSRWSAMKAASLAQATADRVRTVIPFYTLGEEIRLPDGRLLYPKGFTFNPLEFVSLPQRLIVVHPRDLGWAIGHAQLTDFILLTAGDALTLSETAKRPLFILEERVKERLGLTVAPVIVAQAGKALQLTEVRLRRPFGAQSR